MRIERRVFRYVEYELYNYDDTKKELERCREEILESSPAPPEVNVQSGLGDPTVRKVEKLLTTTYIARAEQTIKAIEKSLDMLTDVHRKLFKLKYQDGLPWQEVCLEMDISDRTYFRWRRELVAMVGQQLGLLNIE